MAVAVTGKAQVKQPVKNSIQRQIPFSTFTDSLIKNARPAMMPAAIFKGANRTNGITATCNTTTFKMHLTADAGKKIKLQEIQTMTDGNFLLAGNVTLVNTEQEGLLCVMSNAGAVVAQKQVRINNKPTTIFNIKTMFNGQVAMAGIVHETTDKVFVALLNSDLSVSWLKTIDVTGPMSTLLDVITDNKIYLAAQVNNAVVHLVLSNTGIISWSKQLNITGLDNLAGMGHNNFSALTLSLNCTNAAKKQVQIITVDELSGNIVSSNILGDGTQENKTNKATAFNNRIVTTGITKNNAGQFMLSRQIMFESTQTETLHSYTLGETIDFGISSAQDNAGDVMGFCFPATGKLLFLSHFAYYQSAPEHAVTYAVPVGSSIAGVTRSLNDGGFLFALNTAAGSESILIKTDSIGILAGCNYQNSSINYTEQINVSNVSGISTTNTITANQQAANATENGLSLLMQFDCNQSYCPVLPPEDTCLASYFKTYRSNSYVNSFGTYALMRNNRQLVVTSRLDRVFGDMNTASAGLGLFDENGNFVKGVTVFHNDVSTSIEIKKIDPRHVLMIGYSPGKNTYSLIDDNLQTIWSKSIDYNSAGNEFAPTNVITDAGGNLYLFSNSGGFFENVVRVGVHKMDALGNPVWTKFYEVQATHLLGMLATTTNTSLVLVAEGPDRGSISLNINKTSGELLNVYHYASNSGNLGTNGLLKFQNDRILYTGLTRENNFLMGVLDTTGRPIKFSSIPVSMGLRATTARDGKLYAIGEYFNGIETKELFIKADSSLSFDFINEFDFVRPGYPSGMEVSNEGNIYVPGNYFFGGANSNYAEPTLRKFDPRGVTGTCAYQPRMFAASDLSLQTTVVNFTTLPDGSMTPATIPVTFIPDIYGQQVAELVCSSTPTCTSIKLTGINKLCQLNQPYTYHATRNANCTIKPVWYYDTAFAVLQIINDTTASIRFKKQGSTWIKLKLNAGCSFFTDSMLVQVQQSPGVFSLGNDTALCKGSSIQLNAGSGFNSYLWQDGSVDSIFTVTQPGMYAVTVDNVCGDVYKDTIVVQQINVPLLNIGRDTSICKGDTLQLAATAGFNQYAWKPTPVVNGQGATVTIYPLQNITITAIATTIEGCKAYDTLALSVKAARPVSLGNDASLCTGDSLVLQAGTGYRQYSWSNGAATETVIVKQSGSYSLIATDVNGCKAKDTLQVQLYVLPTPSLGNDFNLCQGSRQQLDAGIFNRYLWQDGSTGRYYNTTTTGTYRVTVTDAHSCTAADTIIVKNIIPLPAGFLKATDSICQYEKMTIGAVGSFASYMWSTGGIQPAITINAPGLYTLTVKNADGCTGSDSIYIFQKDCVAGVFIPSAFTPNGDSKNDVFKAIVHGNLVSFRLQIFSRFGVLVFSATDPQKSWDGKFKGAVLPTSSFIWQCSYQFAGQSAAMMKGNVVMFR
jgi:gliding motility-associated-like protein